MRSTEHASTLYSTCGMLSTYHVGCVGIGSTYGLAIYNQIHFRYPSSCGVVYVPHMTLPPFSATTLACHVNCAFATNCGSDNLSVVCHITNKNTAFRCVICMNFAEIQPHSHTGVKWLKSSHLGVKPTSHVSVCGRVLPFRFLWKW